MESPTVVPASWIALAHNVLNAPDENALAAATYLAEAVLTVGAVAVAPGAAPDLPLRPDDYSVRRELILLHLVR